MISLYSSEYNNTSIMRKNTSNITILYTSNYSSRLVEFLLSCIFNFMELFKAKGSFTGS